VKIVYLAGMGRSGSTIIGKVLSQLKDFFYIGEMKQVWKYGISKNTLCGCGLNFSDCPIWSSVISRAFGIRAKEIAQKMIYMQRNTLRERHAPIIRFLNNPMKFIDKRISQEYRWAINRLYQEIARVTGANIIVDSTKTATYGLLIKNILDCPVYVLHIVRDPGAVAYSWKRSKNHNISGIKVAMRRFSTIKTVLRWGIRNWSVEQALRPFVDGFMLVRYEDFVNNPKKLVRAILKFVHEDSDLSFIHNHKVSLKETHSVWGNPGRLLHGDIKIKLDNEWKISQSNVQRIIIKVLLCIYLYRYSYL